MLRLIQLQQGEKPKNTTTEAEFVLVILSLPPQVLETRCESQELFLLLFSPISKVFTFSPALINFMSSTMRAHTFILILDTTITMSHHLWGRSH